MAMAGPSEAPVVETPFPVPVGPPTGMVPFPLRIPAPASLYVGDLGEDVTDGQVFNHFSEFHSLSSVRVCRDMNTGRSLCYGYVNFVSLQDAMHAIEMKNHSILNGKRIRVMWSHRDPNGRRNGVGNLFVKNLSGSVYNAELHAMFKEFGNILSVKVATSYDGKSKGHGFVQFDNEESANAAIEKVNGSIINGKPIYVAKFIKKSDRASSSSGVKFTNLYMKNLDVDITEDVIREKFSEFGRISSLVISTDENGLSKGFGFVNFDNPDDARRATEVMNGYQLGSKILYVARAQKKTERELILRRRFEEKRREQMLKYVGSNIYIKNIHDDVTEDELREQFSQCGIITSTKLMRDDKGISKGFGFVCFSTPEEANKAVNTFHGQLFHSKPLFVAIAQRKEERQAQLQLYYSQRMSGLVGNSAVIPSPYPSFYYPAPSHGVVPQLAARPGMMYQPLAMRPSWRPSGFATPFRPSFQQTNFHQVMNNPRYHRQHRGRMNELSHGGVNVYYAPNGQQHSYNSLRGFNYQQRSNQVRYVPNGRVMYNGPSGVFSSAVSENVAEGSELLSSRLASATPEYQKHILGERLFPLVQKHKPDLAEKITGMLLEMDNSELLLLLESPEALTAKVDEAVQVLTVSKPNVSGQESVSDQESVSG